jgi:hypothetical protein
MGGHGELFGTDAATGMKWQQAQNKVLAGQGQVARQADLSAV